MCESNNISMCYRGSHSFSAITELSGYVWYIKAGLSGVRTCRKAPLPY